MTVLRIERRNRNFLVVDKSCLQDTELSWGAKGLHSYLMGMHHDWRVCVRDLVNHATNGRDAVRSLLNELKNKGFITVEHKRDNTTGRFGQYEYVVHELSVFDSNEEDQQPNNHGHSHPEPENTPAAKASLAENPAPVDSAPENPLLINNKYNKQQEKQAAASKEVSDELGGANPVSPAAAFSSPKKQTTKPTSTPTPIASPGTELRIGDTLTPAQEQRTTQMINNLSVDDAFKASLRDEVVHCLLSEDCFKACGRDFAHKLNAIRVVIQRGEWQRPSGMVFEAEVKQSNHLDTLNSGLQAAHAEATHFKRLCRSAPGHAKATFEKCVKEAQVRITEMEDKLEAFMSRQASETC
ncbi:MAG: replication protein [Legionellaceae bacterium]|nr:replication protein [Legionellaceae bacterium]